MIKLIKDSPIRIAQLVYCGDGCCSWQEWENDYGKSGETFDEYNFDVGDLVEGVDFILTKD